MVQLRKFDVVTVIQKKLILTIGHFINENELMKEIMQKKLELYDNYRRGPP